MQEIAQLQTESEALESMIQMCNKLIEEWMTELSHEEKEIWLWNASVDMLRIKRRRE